jgi:RecA/RadA recombinase
MATKPGFPTLLQVLLSKNCYEPVMKNRQKFAILAERGKSEALKHYWRYCEKYKEAPAGRKALEEYVSGIAKGGIEALVPEFDEIEGEDPNSITDFNSAFDEAYKKASQTYDSFYMAHAANLAQGVLPNSQDLKRSIEKTYGEDQEKWPWTEIAEKFLAEKLHINPFKIDEDESGGIYQDNTEKVRDRIMEAFADEEVAGALISGFPSIDDNVIIGTGFQQCRLLGVAGQSQRGKTLWLLTTAYNLARQGKHVLYNSLEHSYEDTWMLMAFLHASYFSDEGRFTIPPLDVWAQGKRARNPVSEKDFENFNIIQADARERSGLPGSIDATQYRKWKDIVSHVESSSIKYDVVIVDYLEALDEAISKYGDEEYVNLIKKVQKWTRTYDNNRGIVVMTPLTITKEGAKHAAEFDSENPGTPFYDTDIRGSGSILYYMDLVLGVHSTEDMREKFELLMWGIKKRFGKRVPQLTLLKVDPHTKHVRDIRGRIARREVAEQAVVMDDITQGAF